MTQEEFYNLSTEKFLALSDIEKWKHWIKFTEERYISYKQMLETLFKDKTVYEPGDWRIEFTVWFKEHLREMKNHEEGNLKKLHIEYQHIKEGMNLPYCYIYKRKSSN